MKEKYGPHMWNEEETRKLSPLTFGQCKSKRKRKEKQKGKEKGKRKTKGKEKIS